MNPASRISALDGIRGLSVLAVVIYHAWPSTLPGGWIGVSVFFTLSGFLITQIVDRDHELTRASLTNFWGRRARRLLPAVLATIATTVAVTAIIDQKILRDVSEEGLAATFYLHNWWSLSETGGYWEIFNSDPRPFAHLWSLSIEEQVYLFWPLLVLGLGLRKALLAGAALITIGLILWWGNTDAYFATPFRFTEVFVGALLAYFVKNYPDFKIPGLLAGVSAGGLIWGIFVLNESDPFVTKGALLLIAVASMVITGYALRETKPNLFIGSTCLVWLGKRSYAIYLFHWPFLELLNTSPWIAIALTLVAAEISHHLLEWPIRTGKRILKPLSTLGLVSVISALGLVVIIVVAPKPASQEEINNAVTTALVEIAATSTTTTTTLLSEEPPLALTVPEENPATTSLPNSKEPEKDSEMQENVSISANPKVAIMGDSVAQNLGPALDGWINAVGGEIGSYGFALCSPVFTEENYESFTITLWDQETPHSFGQPCRRAITSEYDLVLVFDHAAVFFDHTNIETDEHYIFPATLALISELYRDLVLQTKTAEATLIFFTAPQIEDRPDCLILGEKRPYRENLEIYNELITEIADSEEHVFVFNTAPRVESEPERYPRPDCVHFEAFDIDSGAINFVTDFIFPKIILGDSLIAD